MRQPSQTPRRVAIAVATRAAERGDDALTTATILTLAGLVASFGAIGSVMTPHAVELLQHTLLR